MGGGGVKEKMFLTKRGVVSRKGVQSSMGSLFPPSAFESVIIPSFFSFSWWWSVLTVLLLLLLLCFSISGIALICLVRMTTLNKCLLQCAKKGWFWHRWCQAGGPDGGAKDATAHRCRGQSSLSCIWNGLGTCLPWAWHIPGKDWPGEDGQPLQH